MKKLKRTLILTLVITGFTYSDVRGSGSAIETTAPYLAGVGPCELVVEEDDVNAICVVMPNYSNLTGAAAKYSSSYENECSSLKKIVDDIYANNFDFSEKSDLGNKYCQFGSKESFANIDVFKNSTVRVISFQPEGMPSANYTTVNDIKTSEEIEIKKTITLKGNNAFFLVGATTLWPDDKHDPCLGDPDDDGPCEKDTNSTYLYWDSPFLKGAYLTRISELSNWVEDHDVTILDPRRTAIEGDYGDEGFPEFALEVSQDYRANIVVELDDNEPALVFKKGVKAVLRNLKITLRGDKGYIMKIEDGAEVWFERSVIVNEGTGDINQLIKVEKGGKLHVGNHWNTAGYEGENLYIINEASAAKPLTYIRFAEDVDVAKDQKTVITGVAAEYDGAIVPFESGKPRKYNYQKIGGATLADGTTVPEAIIDNDGTDDCIFISKTECIFNYFATYIKKDGEYKNEGVFADGQHKGVLVKKGEAKDNRPAAEFTKNISVTLTRDEKDVLSIKDIKGSYKFLITSKGTIHFSNDCGRLNGYHLVGEVCRPITESGALLESACPYGRTWDDKKDACGGCSDTAEKVDIKYVDASTASDVNGGKSYICIQKCGEGLSNKIKSAIDSVHADKGEIWYGLKDGAKPSLPEADIAAYDTCDCPADKPLKAKDGTCTTLTDEDKKCKDAAAKAEDSVYWAYDSTASDCNITCPTGTVTVVTAEGKKTCEGEVTCDEALATKLDNKCVCKYQNADPATCKCFAGTHAEGFGPFATCVADSGSCVSNLECGAGKVCSNSKCVDEGNGTCASDADCGVDKLCKDGLCVNDGGEKVVKGLGGECGGSKVCAEGMVCNDKAKCECNMPDWSYSDITFSCIKANIGKSPEDEEGDGEKTKGPEAKVTKGGDCSLVQMPFNASQALGNAIPYLILLFSLGFARTRRNHHP
ncbi:MAG: hypothetical protein HYT75_08745 [Deltaproteobacteria bacterium]|nr:hypothetical protein [Deltaproteobacteria bacterium]